MGSFADYEIKIYPLSDADSKYVEKEIRAFIKKWFDKKSYVEVPTSGSTGVPRKIRLEKKQMAASAKMTCDFFKINSDSTLLLCLSVKYIAGMMMVIRAIVSKATLIAVEPSENPFKGLKQKIDFTAVVPYQLARAVSKPELIRKIKTIIVGGGPLDKRQEQKMKKIKNNLWHTYGMTETASHIALRKINGKNASDYYTTLPGITVSSSKGGRLSVCSPAIRRKNFVTNDIVEIISDTKFRWRGRYDNIINSGGVKLSPEKIEYKLAGIIKTPFFIASVSDNKLGEKIILIVEKKKVSNKAEAGLLKEKIRPALEKYEMPRKICFVKKILKTPTGKPDRKATMLDVL